MLLGSKHVADAGTANYYILSMNGYKIVINPSGPIVPQFGPEAASGLDPDLGEAGLGPRW